MKKLFAIVALLATALGASGAQIWTVNSVADPADPLPLVWLNASTINTNVFAAYGTAWGDNAGGLWTFKRADATATNTVALGGPVESVNPLSPAGRWFKLIPLNTSAPVTASTNYWLLEVSGGVTLLHPVNLAWQPLVQLPLVVGTNTIAAYGTPSTESFISYRDIVEDTWNPLYTGVSSNTTQLSTVALVPRDTSASVDTQLSQYGYGLSMVTRTNFQGFIWGGATNVLYCAPGTQSLIYTNGGTSVNFEVHNGSGANTAIIAGAGVGTIQTSAAELLLGANGKTLDLNSGSLSFNPSSVGQISLGISGKEWNTAHLTNSAAGGTNYIYFGTNTLSVTGSDIYWNQTKLN